MANPFQIPMAGRSLRNLFSRPATRLYPLEVRPRFAGARGHVDVDIEKCVFCGLCAKRCPAVAIEVSKERRLFAIEHLRCVACGVCVDACNKESLSMGADAVKVMTGPEGGSARARVETLGPPPKPKATPAA
jgi:ech hydrogenase subunit F